MATHTAFPTPGYKDHQTRTATSPRLNDIHHVTLDVIAHANPSVRLLRLGIINTALGIQFLPGQWLDVFVPGLERAGGFTITSTPAAASPGARNGPSLELAVQRSATNPPAEWLWRPEKEILGQSLFVRVGGSFVWPPPSAKNRPVRRLVLVAGGVGINPLISILAHLAETGTMPAEVRVLYATKTSADTGALTDGEGETDVLFLARLHGIVARYRDKVSLSIFATRMQGEGIAARGATEGSQVLESGGANVRAHERRLQAGDVQEALGRPVEAGTVCYICGPRTMTDELVAAAKKVEGMREADVLCEKWW